MQLLPDRSFKAARPEQNIGSWLFHDLEANKTATSQTPTCPSLKARKDDVSYVMHSMLQEDYNKSISFVKSNT